MKSRTALPFSRTASLALTALLLAGCGSLTPPAGTPAADLRSSLRVAPDAAVPALEPALADAASQHAWAAFFTDPRLRQTVGLALGGNRSLRASLAAVERARASNRVVEAARLPEIRANAGASVQGGAAAGADNYSVSLGFSAWEVDLFDRVGSLQGAALARFLAQQETQEAARLAVVAEVANAWLALAAEQERQRIAQAVRDSQQRSLDLTRKQHELGAVSGLVLARAQTAFEAARGEAARSAAAVLQARLALEALVGQPLPQNLLPTTATDGPAAAFTLLPDVPAGLPAEVLLQRPDLRAAEQRLQAAAFDVGAARAARFPRLTLTASAGSRSGELDGLLRRGSDLFSLAPSLDLPIFDLGLRQAQVEAAQASQREALALYEAALQTAFREAADALAVRDSLAERLAAQQAQLQAAQRSLALAEQSYRLGAASQLELLDAERQRDAAQQGLVTLRQTEQANRIALLRALGGRWAGAGATGGG